MRVLGVAQQVGEAGAVRPIGIAMHRQLAADELPEAREGDGFRFLGQDVAHAGDDAGGGFLGVGFGFAVGFRQAGQDPEAGIGLVDLNRGIALRHFVGEAGQRSVAEPFQPVGGVDEFREAVEDRDQMVDRAGAALAQIGRDRAGDIGDQRRTAAIGVVFRVAHRRRGGAEAHGLFDEILLAHLVVAGCSIGGGNQRVAEDGCGAIVLAQAQQHGGEIGIAREDDEFLEMGLVAEGIDDIHRHDDVGGVLAAAGQRRAVHDRERGAGEIGAVLAEIILGVAHGQAGAKLSGGGIAHGAHGIEVAFPDQNDALRRFVVFQQALNVAAFLEKAEPFVRLRGEAFRGLRPDAIQTAVYLIEIDEQRGADGGFGQGKYPFFNGRRRFWLNATSIASCRTTGYQNDSRMTTSPSHIYARNALICYRSGR